MKIGLSILYLRETIHFLGCAVNLPILVQDLATKRQVSNASNLNISLASNIRRHNNKTITSYSSI